MNRILTSLCFVLFAALQVHAQRANQVVFTRTAPVGAARMCMNDAGTINQIGPVVGQSNDFNGDTIYLCLNDQLPIDHRGDQVLTSDPNMGTAAGIGYAFFSCPPTATGPDVAAVRNDPCVFNAGSPTYGFYVFTGNTLSGDVLFFNDGNLQTTFTGGNPAIYHFAPITFDALSMGTFAEYEGTPAGDCVNVRADQSFAVAYLNAITLSQPILSGCQGTFRVRGGVSQLDGSDYAQIRIFRQDDPMVVGTITSGAADHDDVVSFTVPSPGTYVIEVEDGKSCGGTATFTVTNVCDAVTLFLPLRTALPGSNVCVPVVVEDFADILSMQFSVNWDPTVLSITGVQGFNPLMPDLGTTNFGWSANSPFIEPGRLTLSWTDNSLSGLTLADGSILFEVCFDVIGQIGDISELDVTNNPVPIEIIRNADNAQLTLISRPGAVQISSNPFFVRITQDSLTCPSFDDGRFTVQADQGTAPYRIVWNTVPLSGPNEGPEFINTDGGTFTVSNLPAGRYQVTIGDSSIPTQIVMDTIEVLAGPVLGITIRDTIPTCFGARDGSIRFIPTSDGLPVMNPGSEYTFTWSTPASVPNPGNVNFISGIPSGSYGITVTDPSGCQESALIPLGQPPALRILSSNSFITDASCTGGEDGQITVTATGGTPDAGNYNYTWSSGLTISASTTTLSNLNPGQYCVTVTDENGCTFEQCYTVGAVKTLSINGIVTDLLCNGDASGQILVTGSTSGAPAETPYAFAWSTSTTAPANTATTSQLVDLPAGTYIVTMTDAGAAGCEVVRTFTVAEPAALTTTVNFTNETCVVGNDGSVTLSVTGGTSPYTYTWSHNAALNSPTATNLPAGNYMVTVTDTNNCTLMRSQMVSAPTPPQITQLNDDSVTCAEDQDGSLQVFATPAPGTMIASYAWSNGLSGAIINGLSPGQYIVTVTANNACVTIDTALVTAPQPIVLDSVQVRRPSCPGFTDGQIAVFPSGGSSSYRYFWDGAATSVLTNPLPALAAGVHTVRVEDTNGCTSIVYDINVEAPPTITTAFSNVMDTSCPDDNTCDGQATVVAGYSDGSPGDFIFTWASGETTNGGTTSTAVQLCEGTQMVTINDGCGTTAEFTIGAPAPIAVLANILPVSCNGLADGGISLTPSGGTGPYSILWIETGEITTMIDGLAAGSYTAVVADANNCTFTQTVVVNQPNPLVVNVDPLNSSSFVTCAGNTDGVVTVVATGGNTAPGNPYQFTWSNGATGAVNANLPAGTYATTVTDFKGCTATTSFTIQEPPALVFSLDPIEPPLCFGDPTFISIDTVFGGAGNPFEEYTFMVDNNGLNFSVLQPATVFAGDHIVTVEDINGCTAETSVSIVSPGQISITLPPTLVVELGDSTAQLLPVISPSGNYSFQWTPADYLSSDTIRSPFVFPARSTRYTLNIVNENGCTATGSIFVELDANRNVYIPNIFSPNGDGVNDEFRVFTCTGVREVNSVRLFDRWGGILYEGTNFAPDCLNGIKLWDGTKDGGKLPPGVYVYVAVVEFLDGVQLTYRGDVTIIR